MGSISVNNAGQIDFKRRLAVESCSSLLSCSIIFRHLLNSSEFKLGKSLEPSSLKPLATPKATAAVGTIESKEKNVREDALSEH